MAETESDTLATSYPGEDFMPLGSSDEKYYLLKMQEAPHEAEEPVSEYNEPTDANGESTSDADRPSSEHGPETPRLLLNGEPLMLQPHSPVRRKPRIETFGPHTENQKKTSDGERSIKNENVQPVATATSYRLEDEGAASEDDLGPVAVTSVPKAQSRAPAQDETSDDESNKENIAPVATTIVRALEAASRTRPPIAPYPFYRRTAAADFDSPEWHSIDEPRLSRDVFGSMRDLRTIQHAATQAMPCPTGATPLGSSSGQFAPEQPVAVEAQSRPHTRCVGAWWRMGASAENDAFEVVIPSPAVETADSAPVYDATRAQLESEGFSETEAWVTTLTAAVEQGRGEASVPGLGIIEGLVRNPRSGQLIEFQTQGLADGRINARGALRAARSSWSSLLSEAWPGALPPVRTVARIESVAGFQHSDTPMAAGSVRQTVKLLGACAMNKFRFWKLDLKVWYGQIQVKHESRKAKRRESKASRDLVLFDQSSDAARRTSKTQQAVSRVNGALDHRNSTLLTRIEGLQIQHDNIENRLSRLKNPHLSGRYTLAETDASIEGQARNAGEPDFPSLSELPSFNPVIEQR